MSILFVVILNKSRPKLLLTHLDDMKLSEPMDVHMEYLAKEYGFIEILHSISDLMYANIDYQHLVGKLEEVQNAIGNILDSQKSKTIAPSVTRNSESSTNQPQVGES